ncbi:SH3 domain-containing protein [Pyruvatibacter mobilis]|uniref:SH3 domain-containing protein n=1 Tax=Pyruvatibacter mobilis TaxID=1712261 RepID=UPI003BAE82C7
MMKLFGRHHLSLVAVLLTVVFALVLSSQKVHSTADGPDFFAVTGVAPDDVLNVRIGPTHLARVVGAIPHDADGVSNEGCDWGTMDQPNPRPWCKVEYRDAIGYVNARYLKSSTKVFGNMPFGLTETVQLSSPSVRGFEWLGTSEERAAFWKEGSATEVELVRCADVDEGNSLPETYCQVRLEDGVALWFRASDLASKDQPSIQLEKYERGAAPIEIGPAMPQSSGSRDQKGSPTEGQIPKLLEGFNWIFPDGAPFAFVNLLYLGAGLLVLVGLVTLLVRGKSYVIARRVSAAVSIIGTAYAAFAAVAFYPVDRFEGRFGLCETDAARWADLALFAEANRGDVVLIELDVELFVGTDATSGWTDCLQNRYAGYENRYQLNEPDTDAVHYVFPYGFADQAGSNLARELRSKGLFADNGTSITFHLSQIPVNAQTRVQLANEGMEDNLSGPFQVQVIYENAHSSIDLSAPIISDQLAKRIKCAEQEWGRTRQILFCPLL